MANYGFKSVPANYINQYSTLQQDHLEKLREEILGNREDVSTKNKKLSAETNKRRRELANKKKSRETEEERRRLEILAERKARIQDVTYRYQRGGGGAKPNNTNPSPRSRSTRNRRAFSAPVTRHNQINLDDALRTIRGSTQQQYNIGDSGAVFLQKYGAHLQPAGGKEADEASSRHSQSVREPANHSNSLFEQQLVQHQATLKRNNVDTAHVFNERLMQELRNPATINPEQDGDNHSVESLDSLDSEQPSFRSHVINTGYKQPSKDFSNSNNSNSFSTSDTPGGGGTYRQESPTIVVNDIQSSKPSSQTPAVSKQQTKTATTAVTDASSFLGFQVVDTSDSQASRHPQSAELQDRTRHAQQTDLQPRPPTDITSNNRDIDHNDADSFYLKSRTESQTIVADFPSHAWSVSNINQAAYLQSETTPTSISQHHEPSGMNVSDSSLLLNNDMISESASDCGGPRSILKRRNSRSATLPRSHSTPNIRDSLEVTKQHMNSTKVETPQSAKKSVRFSASQSEPVFFQKGSSPSSIPRPVQNKPKNNVPHISGAITPNVSDKPMTGKAASVSPKGPMVANHNIQVSNPGKGGRGVENGKPNILDIQLDRTPTDDEIDVLWDKVRDCLLESPSSSRSAPADIQHPPESSDSSLPPKQPIKKITASNINQIGRAQSAGPRRKTTSESGQSPLQRPKQDQKSFLHTTASNDAARPQYTSGIITQQHSSQAATNGQAAGSAVQNGPTQSAMEPDVSAMVNNTPHDVSESMMAYLTAEQLAGHESLTDQDIMKVMSDSDYRQQLAANGRPVAPMSALSMEEHRILQSLDRLNEKLKVVEEGSHSYRSNQSDYQQPMPSPTSSPLYNGHTSANHSGFANVLTNEKAQLKPHPPYTGGTKSQRSFSATPRGFRGHKPLHPRQRTASADIVRQHNNMTSTQVPGANRQFRLY